jgi:predicted DsbA family dithiol-disulfide isomerase
MSNSISIDVVSDVVCPWCFIGKRHLQEALRLLRDESPEVAPKVRWLPFFLNPDTPEDGEPYLAFMEKKFGGRENVMRGRERLTKAGAASGVEFAFDKIAVRANTMRAHRLLHRTQVAGDADALAERLFIAFFQRGEDVGDIDTLARIAAECGQDEQAVRTYLATDEDREEVQEFADRAPKLGISGVPFFIIDGAIGLSGAQPAEEILVAIKQALQKRTQAQSGPAIDKFRPAA